LPSLLSLTRRLCQRFGFDIVRHPIPESLPTDLPPDLTSILQQARPFSLTSLHRLASTQDAVRYLIQNTIPGAIVECGVWRGGNMVVAAHTLQALGLTDRDLFLYDTFEGMPPPTSLDTDSQGTSAAALLAAQPKGTGIWCQADLADVTSVMHATGYPTAKIHLIKGRVEQTIPQTLPDQIALLRLDTDWYESTLHELVHLYPRLQPGGVLIIDDYGHWRGARQAVDEFFQGQNLHPLLNRIDYTCRIMVKPT